MPSDLCMGWGCKKAPKEVLLMRSLRDDVPPKKGACLVHYGVTQAVISKGVSVGAKGAADRAEQGWILLQEEGL